MGIDKSAAQTFPCPEPDSCHYNLPPITDPKELIAQADLFAIEVLGYQDRNGNSIPDYREVYYINVNDCSTISAQLDEILEQMGLAEVLNAEQASGAGQIRDPYLSHAYNYVPGIGYIDITPIVSGGGPRPNISTPSAAGPEALLYLIGYPDIRERPDPAYQGPLPDSWPQPTLPPIVAEHPEDQVESLPPQEELPEPTEPSSQESPTESFVPSAPAAPVPPAPM